MRHFPSDILRYFLVNGQFGSLPSGTDSWPICVNEASDLPDEMILISDTTGSMDGRSLRTGRTYEHFGLQVLVRSTDRLLAWRRIQILAKVMDSIFRQRVLLETDEYLLQSITRTTPIIPLGTAREEKERARKRYIFTTNGLATISPTIDPVVLPDASSVPSLQNFWVRQTPVGTVNGTNRIFTFTALPDGTVGFLLYVNGVLQRSGSSYEYVVSSTTITFNAGKAPPNGATLILTYVTP